MARTSMASKYPGSTVRVGPSNCAPVSAVVEEYDEPPPRASWSIAPADATSGSWLSAAVSDA